MRQMYEGVKKFVTWPSRALRKIGNRISARIWRSPFFFLLPLSGAAGFVLAAVAATEKALHAGSKGLTLLWALAVAKCALAGVTSLSSVAEAVGEGFTRRERKESAARKKLTEV